MSKFCTCVSGHFTPQRCCCVAVLQCKDYSDAVLKCRYLCQCTSGWLLALQVISMTFVFPSDSTEVAHHYCHRATILRESEQPLAALQDYLRAAEVSFRHIATLRLSLLLCQVCDGLTRVTLRLIFSQAYMRSLHSHNPALNKHARCTSCQCGSLNEL